jgi:hypothetical protein
MASSNSKFSIASSQKDMRMFSSIKSFGGQTSTAKKPPLAAKSPVKQIGRKVNSTIDVNFPLEVQTPKRPASRNSMLPPKTKNLPATPIASRNFIVDNEKPR